MALQQTYVDCKLNLHYWHHNKRVFTVNYLLLHVLMKCCYKLPEYGDKAEAHKNQLIERIHRL
jgi:hypothetical protein